MCPSNLNNNPPCTLTCSAITLIIWNNPLNFQFDHTMNYGFFWNCFMQTSSNAIRCQQPLIFLSFPEVWLTHMTDSTVAEPFLADRVIYTLEWLCSTAIPSWVQFLGRSCFGIHFPLTSAFPPILSPSPFITLRINHWRLSPVLLYSQDSFMVIWRCFLLIRQDMGCGETGL